MRRKDEASPTDDASREFECELRAYLDALGLPPEQARQSGAASSPPVLTLCIGTACYMCLCAPLRACLPLSPCLSLHHSG